MSANMKDCDLVAHPVGGEGEVESFLTGEERLWVAKMKSLEGLIDARMFCNGCLYVRAGWLLNYLGYCGRLYTFDPTSTSRTLIVTVNLFVIVIERMNNGFVFRQCLDSPLFDAQTETPTPSSQSS